MNIKNIKMRKAIRKIALVVILLVAFGSGYQIITRVNTGSISVMSVVQNRSSTEVEHKKWNVYWDILGYEALMIAGAYGAIMILQSGHKGL